MIDFSSASYLGNQFSTVRLDIDSPITVGKPAFLKEPMLNRWIGNQVAKMQGLERGIIAPSSLHLFWDIFGILDENYAIFVEENTYPIGQWGSFHAEKKGIRVEYFDINSKRISQLPFLIEKFASKGLKPLIVTDSFNLDSGIIQPLEFYESIIKPKNGILLIDDTQTFGVFGNKKDYKNFGKGGGGILPFLDLSSKNIISVTSLSKAFGLPMAVLSGSSKMIRNFEKNSLTRMHASQVSKIHALSAAYILEKNNKIGDNLRLKLWNNINLFRREISKSGCVKLTNGIFPVQKISINPQKSLLEVYQNLLGEGIECLLLAPPKKEQISKLAFCIRADHQTNEILKLTTALNKILGNQKTSRNSHFLSFSISNSHERNTFKKKYTKVSA